MNKQFKHKTSHKKNKLAGFRRFLSNYKGQAILKMRRKKGRKKL